MNALNFRVEGQLKVEAHSAITNVRWLGGVTVMASDFDQAVVGSISGRAAIKLPRATQPSVPPW